MDGKIPGKLPLNFRFPVGEPEDESGYPEYWGSRKKLYCRTGYHLCVDDQGWVYGTNSDTDKNAVLELKSVDSGVVCLKGVQSGCFIAFDRKGRLHGSTEYGDHCLFEEDMTDNYYTTYRSHLYRKKKWHIAINKKGKVKSGKKTKRKKKSSHFLPR